MNTDMILETESTSSDDTLRLGEAVGKRLKGGEVIELISDLGGGKTVFVRGLAKGIKTQDAVASPSFMISRVYRGKNSNIHHYDFYRLNDPGVVRQELSESINDSKVAVAVEWADVIERVLPNDRLQVMIKVTGENSRNFIFKAGLKHEQLLRDLR